MILGTYPPPQLGVIPITTCPHCSKLVEGSCMLCDPGDIHPSCEGCEEGRVVVPWYRSDMFVSIVAAVVVSVASGIIVAKIQGAMSKKKKK